MEKSYFEKTIVSSSRLFSLITNNTNTMNVRKVDMIHIHNCEGMSRQKISENTSDHLSHNIRRNNVGRCRSSLPNNPIFKRDSLANLDTVNGNSTLNKNFHSESQCLNRKYGPMPPSTLKKYFKSHSISMVGE